MFWQKLLKLEMQCLVCVESENFVWIQRVKFCWGAGISCGGSGFTCDGVFPAMFQRHPRMEEVEEIAALHRLCRSLSGQHAPHNSWWVLKDEIILKFYWNTNKDKSHIELAKQQWKNLFNKYADADRWIDPHYLQRTLKTISRKLDTNSILSKEETQHEFAHTVTIVYYRWNFISKNITELLLTAYEYIKIKKTVTVSNLSHVLLFKGRLFRAPNLSQRSTFQVRSNRCRAVGALLTIFPYLPPTI